MSTPSWNTPTSRALLVASLMGVGLLACSDGEIRLTSFEGPSDVAVLPTGSIFDVSVAFVANARSGDIAKLDLTRQNWLADTEAGPLFRGRPLPTGRTRLLEQVAVYSSDHRPDGGGGETFVTLFASDSIRQSLLVVPYLDSAATVAPQTECINDPSEPLLFPRYPICVRYDSEYGASDLPAIELDNVPGSVAVAYLSDIEIREGRTTTERWTVTFDEDFQRFDVVGSLSGVQQTHPVVGEAWLSKNSALGFTVYVDSGDLRDGDSFSVQTDNGVVELPLPGVVQDLAFDPYTGLLFATVHEPSPAGGAIGHVIAVDAERARTQGLGAELYDIPLPEGVLPSRMDLVDGVVDSAGVTQHVIYFSDPSAAGVAHRLDLADATVEDLQGRWQVLEVGFPSVDVAFSRAPEAPWLYLGALNRGLESNEAGRPESFRVRVYDVVAGAEIDTNPNTPYITAEQCQIEYCPDACTTACEREPIDAAECQASCEDTCRTGCQDEGIPVSSPISGMAASHGVTELAREDNAGRPYYDHLIVVTTTSGSMYTIEASRACTTFFDPRGPYVLSSNFTDVGNTSNEGLWEDPITGRTAVGSTCGGITRAETWIVRYDSLVGAWRVEGSISGPQMRLAFTDRRYISDGGEISFMVASGTYVPTDGDVFTIYMEDNVAVASSFELPQDPATFELIAGGSDAGWYDVTVRQAAVVASNGNDTVFAMDLAPALLSSESDALANLGEFQ